jgi:hypothetical protein
MESGIYLTLEKVFTGRTYKFYGKDHKNILPCKNTLEFNWAGSFIELKFNSYFKLHGIITLGVLQNLVSLARKVFKV